MSAWKRLRMWIEHFPGLTDQLRKAGYDGRQRSLTPQQVQLIVNAIGEP
ncbi:MAG: DUF4248 domain-containing protein [Prevotella sp.]|nr:DUF4248 domain-containing protein [Prevotella sp.]MBQ4393614.1 DUF4248 domain-containing protein [Prevotella sp.]